MLEYTLPKATRGCDSLHALLVDDSCHSPSDALSVCFFRRTRTSRGWRGGKATPPALSGRCESDGVTLTPSLSLTR